MLLYVSLCKFILIPMNKAPADKQREREKKLCCEDTYTVSHSSITKRKSISQQ